MPIYKISHEDFAKMADKDLNKHWFLATAKTNVDHGDYITISLPEKSPAMLMKNLGITLEYVHPVDHNGDSSLMGRPL